MARRILHLHGLIPEPLPEVHVVLLSEQGGGNEHGHLLAAVYGRETCAQSDLGLAKTDVAADHAVHGLIGAEVGEDIIDRLRLVLG